MLCSASQRMSATLGETLRGFPEASDSGQLRLDVGDAGELMHAGAQRPVHRASCAGGKFADRKFKLRF